MNTLRAPIQIFVFSIVSSVLFNPATAAPGDTELVSVRLAGQTTPADESASGRTSANGGYVVFQSNGGDIVKGDRPGTGDIFIRDLETGVSERISVAANPNAQPSGPSRNAVVSADGRYVAFESGAG